MRECLKCGRGFFSFEAGVSLLFCLVFLSMIHFHSSEDLSEVMAYKKASDFLDVIIKDGSLETEDQEHMKLLLDELGLKARVVLDGKTVFDQQHNTLFKIERTLVGEDSEYKQVVMSVGT